MKIVNRVVLFLAVFASLTLSSPLRSYANEKGNGQLVVKVKGEWMPLEVGVIYLSREYFSLKHLLQMAPKDAIERQYVASLKDWIRLLKDYAPVQAKEFEASAENTPWVIVDGDIGIQVQEYPDQAVKFEDEHLAGAFYKGKIYLSVPKLASLNRIPQDDRVQNPDRGFVMLHELINRMYLGAESDDDRLARGEEIAKILINHTTPAQYQAALVYDHHGGEGLFNSDTPLSLKIDTLKEIAKDWEMYDINSIHKTDLIKITPSIIEKMERIQKFYGESPTHTLWGNVDNQKTFFEMYEAAFEGETNLESYFKTIQPEKQLYSNDALFDFLNSHAEVDFKEILEKTVFWRLLPGIQYPQYKGYLQAPYQKIHALPGLETHFVKLVQSTSKIDMDMPHSTGKAIVTYCAGFIFEPIAVDIEGRFFEQLSSMQEKCVAAFDMFRNIVMSSYDNNAISWENDLGVGRSYFGIYDRIESMPRDGNVRYIFLTVLKTVIEARNIWKKSSGDQDRQNYIAKLNASGCLNAGYYNGLSGGDVVLATLTKEAKEFDDEQAAQEAAEKAKAEQRKKDDDDAKIKEKKPSKWKIGFGKGSKN